MSEILCLAAVLMSSVAPAVNESGRRTRQDVDLIELNHFLDDQGREVFQQLIFYEWSRHDREFHVRAWRLIKQPGQMPRRQWKPDGYLCSWRDNALTREVWSPSLRETWTQKDPERVNRQILPENLRRPLWPKD
ncbi:hypothetical protein [Stieleria varia]|uniref:Uncharacterized protein n=1 Tax=Stieleria varia TaxID=2528005 RepID=A0A5C6AWW7_9BACT|nr:hypothetical protein [Stieleria varia]TWU04433.1 hypothetical protein Pla52n_24740 [Stieleria varia]